MLELATLLHLNRNLNMDTGQQKQMGHGKYGGWNGSIVKISYWVDLAQLLAGIKKQPQKCLRVVTISQKDRV